MRIMTLNTLDNREDQNYEENKRSIKPMDVYLRRLEQRYMEEKKEIKEMNQTQQPPWLVNNILFCYEVETHMGNESERKQHFLLQKEKAYTDGSKSIGRKLGYAAVFAEGHQKRGTSRRSFYSHS